jgi:heme/copper-type cytochrome/quinol oxidase subunit 3
MSDGVYGSCFYMATGFHGFHVFVGTCAIIVQTIRLYLHHFTKEHHFGFEAAAWYWHFVDVVWLFFVLCYLLVGWCINNNSSFLNFLFLNSCLFYQVL